MMENTICARRNYVIFMGVGTVFIAALMVTVYLVIVQDVIKQPNSAGRMFFALFMLAFLVAMTVISAVAFASSIKLKLILREGGFAWRHWWKTTQYELGDITAVWWRQGRVVLLTTAGRKIKLEVHEYHAADRAAVIRFFRLKLSMEIQNGWKKFWAENWSVFDLTDPSDPQFIAEKTASRRLIDICFIASVLMAFFADCIIWQITSNAREAFAPLAIMLFWPIRFLPLISTCGQGPVSIRVTEQMPPKPKVLGCPATLAISVALGMCVVAMICNATGVSKGDSQWIEWMILAVAALATAALPFCMARDARAAWRREWNARAAEEAEKVYLRLDIDG